MSCSLVAAGSLKAGVHLSSTRLRLDFAWPGAIAACRSRFQLPFLVQHAFRNDTRFPIRAANEIAGADHASLVVNDVDSIVGQTGAPDAENIKIGRFFVNKTLMELSSPAGTLIDQKRRDAQSFGAAHLTYNSSPIQPSRSNNLPLWRHGMSSVQQG